MIVAMIGAMAMPSSFEYKSVFLRGGQYKEINGICSKISQYPPHLVIDGCTIPLENISGITINHMGFADGYDL